MEILTFGSLDDERPRARLALLLESFSELSNDREPQRILYPLHEVLLLVTCATIASCDDFDDIVLWGEHHLDFLRSFSAFHFGVPCARWVRALFNRIDPALFARCFASFTAALWPERHDLIAIDGKTARRTLDKRKGLKARHTLSAYATNARLTLAQLSVPEKTNEITAIPDLLDQLARAKQLDGALVAIDAMGCQVAIADKIVARGADYLLGLKGNQPILRRGRQLFRRRARDGAGDENHRRKRPRPHRNAPIRGLRQGRLDPVAEKLSRRAGLLQRQDHPQASRARRARRPLQLRDALFHLLGALRHRTPGRRGARPLGRGEHALAARRRVQGRSEPPPRRPPRQKHGDPAPLRPRPRARQQIKGQRQIQTKSRRLEPPIPPPNPST